jgi:uncharacterized protein (DUF885 family)
VISRRGLLATGAAAGALAACGRADEPPPGLFAGALADWAREIAEDDPERATSAGLGPDIAGEGVHARLTDRSALALERRRAASLRRLVQLRAIDRATLSAPDAVTFDILNEVFEANAAGAEFSFGRIAIGGLRPYTLNALDSAFSTLPGFFDSTQPLRRLADADDYLARLRQVADALDAETARARADAESGIIPPDFVIDRALALVDSILAAAPEASPYASALQRSAPSPPPPHSCETTSIPPIAARIRRCARCGRARCMTLASGGSIRTAPSIARRCAPRRRRRWRRTPSTIWVLSACVA